MAKNVADVNEGDGAPTAGPGDNVPEGVFLSHVQKIIDANREVDEQSSILKGKQDARKRLRQAAKAEGIMLGELDQALELIDQEEEGVASLSRVLKYAEMMRAPIGTQFKMFDEERPTLDVAFDKGFNSSMQGIGTEECPYGPGEEREAYLKGWHEHQKRIAEEMKQEEEAVH
ncbi:hypothetical protein QMT40_001809 [Parvibaculaceae bacterium PLY_AMNH_Bact1]|nr:hypothetical protein QMT40_001809 [Parvibaculaceae bacterium PLY_AMNH_Bact1]